MDEEWFIQAGLSSLWISGRKKKTILSCDEIKVPVALGFLSDNLCSVPLLPQLCLCPLIAVQHHNVINLVTNLYWRIRWLQVKTLLLIIVDSLDGKFSRKFFEVNIQANLRIHTSTVPFLYETQWEIISSKAPLIKIIASYKSQIERLRLPVSLCPVVRELGDDALVERSLVERGFRQFPWVLGSW